MISKAELKEKLKTDKKNNIGTDTFFHKIYIVITRNPSWLRWKYIKYMRLESYYREKYKTVSKLFIVQVLLYSLKKNRLGYKLNFEVGGKNIGEGITIYHNGPIVIHGDTVIGKNCKLHGDNCIGNDGSNDRCPRIGNNVDIGVGAKIIGDVYIADDITIGAGAVVVSSFYDKGIVIGRNTCKNIKIVSIIY